jgi:hypothetical protein
MANRSILRDEISQQGGKLTSKQKAEIREKRTALYRRIQRWREIQLAYTPIVATLLVADGSANIDPSELVEQPEHLALHLPSGIPCHLRQAEDIKILADKECRLRIAQADEALSDIRRARRTITGLTQFKKFNICGTGNKPNTRMRTLYNRWKGKINRAAERYRAARAALLLLQPDGGDWHDRLRKLDPSDIRGPGKATDDPTPVPNGRYETSWIWLVSRCDGAEREEDEGLFIESLRAEWAKMLARSHRWEEEYLLVQEEMRRVIAYLQWKADWWKEQGSRRVSNDAGLVEGLLAYAEKQAALFQCLIESCVRTWLPALKKEGIVPSWSDMFKMTDNKSDEHEGDTGGDKEEQEVLDDESEEEEGGNGFDHLDLDL